MKNQIPKDSDNVTRGSIMRSANKDRYQPEIYEFLIQGHLQDKWAGWFEGLSLTRLDDGSTKLCGQLPDQTALHSILLKIRDMNLILIYVKKIQKSPE